MMNLESNIKYNVIKIKLTDINDMLNRDLTRRIYLSVYYENVFKKIKYELETNSKCLTDSELTFINNELDQIMIYFEKVYM